MECNIHVCSWRPSGASELCSCLLQPGLLFAPGRIATVLLTVDDVALSVLGHGQVTQ